MAGAMLGGEAEGGTLPPLSAQRLPQRVIKCVLPILSCVSQPL